MTKLKIWLKRPPHSARAWPIAAGNASAATRSFNGIINRLSSEGSHHEVLVTFTSMLNSSTSPDSHTYPSLLKACTSLSRLSLGLSLHTRIILDGFSPDSYISSSLISFYAKFGRVEDAQCVFDDMPERSLIPWTAMIGCYSRFDDVDRAFEMYNLMQYEGIQPSSVAMLSLVSGVSDLSQLECLHASALQTGCYSDVNLVNCMLHIYSKCGRVEAARNLFEEMDQKDMVSWNSMLSGYAENQNVKEHLYLLRRMRIEGIGPDEQTFGTFLMSLSDVKLGMLVHGQMVTAGVIADAPLATSLIVFYSKFGKIRTSLKVFAGILDKDVILWTAMISGLVQNDCADKAISVFNDMLKSGIRPLSGTISALLAGCGRVSSLALGKSVHGYLLRQGIDVDITVQNSLITMYAKSGQLKQSSHVFDNMWERDVVSWNAIVAGYAEDGDLCEAFSLFNEMRYTLEKPDSITVLSLLQACASIGALQQGKWMHNFVVKCFLRPSILVDTALVDMYLKCGDLHTAQKCFDRMPEHDIVSWSTIIAGYGSHGKGEIALKLFSSFLHSRFQPNHAIFLCILFACSHNGLVSEGLSLFKSMTEDFGIEPKLEHRASIVDLLCRAGRLEEAYSFVKAMISKPTVEVLGILLDACKTKGNVELREIIAGEIVNLQPISAEKYVQLAQSYASMNRWDGMGYALIQMRSLGLRKLPGWSYIEQHGKIATFYMDDCSHPQYEEMLWVLEVLGCEMSDLMLDVKKPRTWFPFG
ncbi:hypothetical protein Dimus_035100 [Dionaea muscipula]